VCFVNQSVKRFGSTTPHFSNTDPRHTDFKLGFTTPRFQTRLTPLMIPSIGDDTLNRVLRESIC